jgi:hypothetical protein
MGCSPDGWGKSLSGHTAHRRFTLTAKGRAKLAETDALWAKAQRGFEIAFGRAQSEALREALRFLVSDNFVTTFESSLTSSAR